MKIVIFELQYFDGCPSHDLMRRNPMRAIQGIEDRIRITEILVEDDKSALRAPFRGSPTLLINGEDLEGMVAPAVPSLACRFYRNGISSAEFIRAKIEEAYLQE